MEDKWGTETLVLLNSNKYNNNKNNKKKKKKKEKKEKEKEEKFWVASREAGVPRGQRRHTRCPLRPLTRLQHPPPPHLHKTCCCYCAHQTPWKR
jgi:hypothetical protein